MSAMDGLVQPMLINGGASNDNGSIGTSSSTDEGAVKAKAGRKRKELFQINTHPAATISANNKRDLRLKKIVMRVVEFCKKEHEEGLQIPFRFFKKRASVMTGVSLSTIHRIETIDMQDVDLGTLEKPARESQNPVRKKKKDGGHEKPAKKCARRKKTNQEAHPAPPGPAFVAMSNGIHSNANTTTTGVNGNSNTNTLSLSTLQPAVHAYAVAGTVATAVSATLNPFTTANVVSNQPAAIMGQDRAAACSWAAGPVGPFTVGELKDTMVPVAFATGQLDASGWPGGTVSPFATSVQGATTALVGHQVIQTYQATPTHAQGGRNSPVFFQF